MRTRRLSDLVEQLGSLSAEQGLVVSATAYLTADDGLAEPFKSVVLLSPAPKVFWSVFSVSEEANDGLPDPIDRWSSRVVAAISSKVSGLALFPFQGPPYFPFSAWARRSAVAWQSPSGLLVHETDGLWISFRGAIALDCEIGAAQVTVSPCEVCPRPCLTACPVGAFRDGSFDHASCLAHVQSERGTACLENGCIARGACPIGRSSGPPQEQLRMHMQAFAKGSAEK